MRLQDLAEMDVKLLVQEVRLMQSAEAVPPNDWSKYSRMAARRHAVCVAFITDPGMHGNLAASASVRSWGRS